VETSIQVNASRFDWIRFQSKEKERRKYKSTKSGVRFWMKGRDGYHDFFSLFISFLHTRFPFFSRGFVVGSFACGI